VHIIKLVKRYFTDILFIALIAIVIYFFTNMKAFWPILIPFLIALFLSYLLKPCVDFLETKIRSRDISILISFAIIFGITIMVFVYFIPLFVSETKQLIQNIPDYIILIQKWFFEID